MAQPRVEKKEEGGMLYHQLRKLINIVVRSSNLKKPALLTNLTFRMNLETSVYSSTSIYQELQC